MATYTELIQAKLTTEQYEQLVLYCHKENVAVSKLIRKLLGEKVEGKEW